MSEEIKVNKRKIVVSHSDEPVKDPVLEEDKPRSETVSNKVKVIQPLNHSPAPTDEVASNSDKVSAEGEVGQVKEPSKVTLGSIVEDSSGKDSKPGTDLPEDEATEATKVVAGEDKDSEATAEEPKPEQSLPAEQENEAEPIDKTEEIGQTDPSKEETQEAPTATNQQVVSASVSQEPVSSLSSNQNQKTKQVVITKKYKVKVGSKDKRSRQRKNRPKKGIKVLIIILAVLLALAGLWAYAFYVLPAQALPKYLERLSTAESYSYELDVKLIVPSSNDSNQFSSHLEGKLIRSAGKVQSSETEIGEGTTTTTFTYVNDTHYQTTGSQVISAKASEVVSTFGNQCGANETAALLNAAVQTATDSNPDSNLTTKPWLFERQPRGLGLAYEGNVDSVTTASLFDDVVRNFSETCSANFASEHQDNLDRLFSNVPVQIELNQGWGTDRLILTAEYEDVRLSLDFVTGDYNRSIVPRAPTIGESDKKPADSEPVEESCEAGCRDEERQADLEALNTLLTSYYESSTDTVPSYPLAEDLIAANFSQADPEIFIDPDGASVNQGDEFGYIYQALPAGCDNVQVVCSEYSLRTTLESSGATYEYRPSSSPNKPEEQ